MSKISKWIIAFILLFSVFHDIPKTYANTGSIIVDAKSLHIRSGPGLTHSVTGSLKKGERVGVISTSGDWYEIQIGNGSGWIASWLTASTNQPSATSTTVVSRVNQLNVRSSASIGSAVLARLSAGDEAILTNRDGEWAAITFNGISGWVHTDYITELSEEHTSELQSPLQSRMPSSA